jgi:serine/threonine protein phosphatase PrpC
MKYTLFQESRIGKRPYQQDRLAYWHTKEALFMAVADGMGGHAHGDVAAQIAIDCLGGAFRNEAKRRSRTRTSSCSPPSAARTR